MNKKTFLLLLSLIFHVTIPTSLYSGENEPEPFSENFSWKRRDSLWAAVCIASATITGCISYFLAPKIKKQAEIKIKNTIKKAGSNSLNLNNSKKDSLTSDTFSGNKMEKLDMENKLASLEKLKDFLNPHKNIITNISIDPRVIIISFQPGKVDAETAQLFGQLLFGWNKIEIPSIQRLHEHYIKITQE